MSEKVMSTTFPCGNISIKCKIDYNFLYSKKVKTYTFRRTKESKVKLIKQFRRGMPHDLKLVKMEKFGRGKLFFINSM